MQTQEMSLQGEGEEQRKKREEDEKQARIAKRTLENRKEWDRRAEDHSKRTDESAAYLEQCLKGMIASEGNRMTGQGC